LPTFDPIDFHFNLISKFTRASIGKLIDIDVQRLPKLHTGKKIRLGTSGVNLQTLISSSNSILEASPLSLKLVSFVAIDNQLKYSMKCFI